MDAGKIATIELNMDSKEKKDKKQREPGKLKSFLQAYGKYVGAGAVALALVIVCAVSLADRIANREVATGVMMTVADLTKDKEPFSGDLFASTAISYNDMVNVNYETDQLAQLERAEQQIDEILTARRQDKRDQVALEALTAVHSGPGEIGEYDPNAVGKYQYLGEYLLTAYCPCPICCGKWSNMENPITASGARATAGWTIAAPKNFAFGTKIMIDGQIYEVQDRGGAITGNHFDVFCNTHQEALNFNMRTTSAYLVVE